MAKRLESRCVAAGEWLMERSLAVPVGSAHPTAAFLATKWRDSPAQGGALGTKAKKNRFQP